MSDTAAGDGAEIYIVGQITALPLGVHLTLAAISVATDKVVASQSLDMNALIEMASVAAPPQAVSAAPGPDPNSILLPTGTGS